MRGLVIGRFQPFHDGHRQLIERIADDVDEVVVGIGSAGASHTRRDPFTSGERVQMVQPVLDELDAKTYLIPLTDVERNALWVGHVRSLCPRFEAVYSNNPFVERLFEEADIEVRGTPMFDRERYRGSDIRDRIVAGEPWRDRVPDAVVEGIEQVDGVARLQAITLDDE